jgi:signal transduction histidine kinase/CheY-like chemotaxis protein
MAMTQTSVSGGAALTRDASGAEDPIQVEQVRLLHTNLPTSQLVALLNGAILAFVQSFVFAASRTALWLSVLLIVTLGRLLLRQLFLRAAPEAAREPRWRALFMAGAFASGLVWGAAAWVLYPPEAPSHQMFLAFVLGGMVAGSVSVLTPVFEVFVVFAVAVLVPLGVRYGIAGDPLHYAMAAMTGIFLAAILVIGKQIHRTIRSSLELRFENLAMIDDLINARTYVESVNAELLAAQGALKRSNEELERRVADRTKALHAHDRRKDEFLAVLSHELRNPLAPIRNSIYVLGHVDPASAQAREAREVIERQTYYITRLVDDLLDVTRIARGKIELRRERVNLTELVKRTGEDHASTFRSLDIGFSVDAPAPALWASVDRTRVAQLIGNLLHNAANFTPAGGRVALALRACDGHAEIRVSDTGAGIDRELLPSLFEPFTQGSRSLARTEGGLGLGLALVKGISELHGGSVSAASGGLGQGAEFVVRLPLQAEAANDASPPPPLVQRLGSRRRILIVDDNRDAAETLAHVVGMFGHDTKVAYDGKSALETAQAGWPEVVLCDLGLPDLDGYEVARILRGAQSKARLIAVSGYAQPDDVARARDSGFDTHLAKPVDIEALRRLIA